MRVSGQDKSAGRGPGRSGVSLLEAVIASLLVATMLVAALSALAGSARAARSQADKALGANLARQMMGEVLQARYQEPNGTPAFGIEAPESATSRSAWDDVDDYHGWSATPPQTKEGAELTYADGWTRAVTVEYVLTSNPNQTIGADQGLKRITVTVTSPTGKTSTLIALRSDQSIYDEQPDTQTTYVSAVNVELQIGPSAATRVSSGTNILNRVTASP